MDIRSVQKTGDMHYIYLPTAWCKKHHITSSTKVSIEQTTEGTLTIFPQLHQKKRKELTLSIQETDPDILHKLIIACYINPTDAFFITLEKKIDASKMFSQKQLVSLENVEVDNKQISCESTVSVSDPASLLTTMVRKIKNLIQIVLTNYDKDIVERYEEEIDRSRLLIDKAVISAYTLSTPSDLKMIDLHYIATISKELERIVDQIIVLDTKHSTLLELALEIIESLKKILEDIHKDTKYRLTPADAISFVKQIFAFQKAYAPLPKSPVLQQMENSFMNIGDVLMDMAITHQLEEK